MLNARTTTYQRYILILLGISLSTTSLQAIVPATPHDGVFVGVDYLFWKTEEDGLVYGATVEKFFGSFIGDLPTGNITLLEPCFTWNSGVRFDLGYSWCHEWLAWGSWTRLHTNPFSHLAHSTADILTIPFSTVFPTYATDVKSNLCFNFDALDLDFGKLWYSAHDVSIFPFIGMKWTRIAQRLTLLYRDARTQIDFNDPNIVSAIRTNHFTGFGPHCGVQGSWNVGHGFHLLGLCSGALMYGPLCVTEAYKFPIPNVFTLAPRIVAGDKKLRANVQVQLGLGWEYCFCEEYNIEIYAAYEAQYWWHQWQCKAVLSGDVPPLQGDLTFHGITIGIGIDF